ncbi:Cof-type HAD-IIB family hydrolase [Chromobacterium alticapitis]|uniref:Cof-type HAD-IIB family hydrolase n=1 Tax=Chromobacterium alticapitis TaxID=2073169 RepID=A0A2S5DAD8_9NEIS|nr:Cof-type HAD-IIB family hydrolase [Chromobacterium alticapitis]POZ59937.1 Cof-type HAD-IIB family hydrolase [Chromobacterium alticapitis]
MQFIVSDLDGTLLDADSRVAPETHAVLRQAMARGIPMAIATGRHERQVRQLWPKDLPPVPVISANGARVHLADGSLLFQSHLSPDLLKRLLRPERVRDTELGVYRDDCIMAYHSKREFSHYTGQVEEIADLERFCADDVSKVIYCGTPEQLKEVELDIARDLGDEVSMTYSHVCYLEVMAPGVHKGSALAMLLKHLGVDAAGCAAFGDNLNDAEMLQLAGLPHVMANAHPELKRRLPDVPVIGRHDEAAVARQLVTMLNQKV